MDVTKLSQCKIKENYHVNQVTNSNFDNSGLVLMQK